VKSGAPVNQARFLSLRTLVFAAGLAPGSSAFADTAPAAGTGESAPSCTASAAKRPEGMFNRWEEDGSVLANPCVPHKPFDDLKYIRFGGDPQSYLSRGADLRERVESNDAPLFGIGGNSSGTYLLRRAEGAGRRGRAMLIRVRGYHDGIKEHLEKGQKQGREMERDEMDERVILAGDLDLTEDIIESIDTDAGRYLNVTVSFKDEVDRELPGGIVREFEAFALHGTEVSDIP
jgi:hypothetical protein